MRSLSAMTKEPGLVAVGKILVVPTMPSQFQRLQIQIEITGHRPASSWPESAAALHPRLWAQFWSHWCTILVSVAAWLLMHPRCRQVTALLVSDAFDVLNEFCGAWWCPGTR
jgi:hypothetical protein